MTETVIPVFKILPTTQKYDWGKIGNSSKVAQFAAASQIPGFVLDSHAPYAELWMGTHPSSPSHLLSDVNATLASYLAAHPQLIGEKVLNRFKSAGAAEGNLPFLFKILAIGKALSIQTHPDKATAEKLHKEQPNVYKDANHKPEMAIALTDFTALCGFLPLPKVAAYLKSTPEFAALIPTTIVDNFIAVSTDASSSSSSASEKAALKDLFAAVMTAEPGLFTTQLDKLIQRYTNGGASEVETEVKELVLTLYTQFPGDIGIWCAFMLNYVKMSPGEAIFLSAGEPHAYISGDMVETMATSDNVIRAGLTPKLRDVPNLVNGLTYQASESSKHMIQPAPFHSTQHTKLYDPPIPEFSVLLVGLKPGEKEVHPAIDGPSILIVTEGSGKLKWGAPDAVEIRKGEVVFVGAGTELELYPWEDDELSVYRAFVDVRG
ncbi:Mannose-6-phosphate isomerase [Steccherinum ochraceum]|uniref:Mannose-6-phosphate isomerase n=1 Tax=Steccherinum ochraceum TaxID=92696 RepID=A0A4R0R5M5_9APHY|nr:Mannose-6-phosphate isomerase [Steccherinum ochraceum]